MKRTRCKMQDAMTLYMESARVDGRAASTLANMASHARKLEGAIRDWQAARNRWQPLYADEVDTQLVTFFLARCVGGEGNKSNMVAYLRNLLRYCERNRWMEAGTTDIVTYTSRGKPFQRKHKTYIEPERFPELLASQTRHPSDRATMALLLWTLCRKSELYALRWGHVDLGSERMLQVYRVKTKRRTAVAICPELHAELVRYRQWYQAEMGAPIDPDWHVLPELVPHRVYDHSVGHYGRDTWYSINPARTPNHMEHIVKRALDAIDVKDTVQGKTVNHVGEGAHTIRRSGARAMLKHLSAESGFGDALATVAAMLDHKDVKVTLNYIGMEKQKDELNSWLKTNSPYGSLI
jgi:integrase